VNDQHLIRRAQSMYRRVSSTIQQKQVGGKAADLMGNEDRKHGSVSLGTVTKYYSAAVAGKNGTFILVVVLFLFCCVQVIKVMGDLWIGIWARYEQGDNTDSGEKSTLYYIVVLTILLGAIIFATLCRSYYFLYACVGASANLHRGMLESVLSASVNKYFDVTPIGRILNRFTKDMDVIDSLLPDYLLMALQGGFHIIAILILCLASTPYFFIAFFPIMVLFYFLQRHFRLTSRELKRLDGISRSPIYNHLSETLNGLATIRAYGKQDTFLRIHHDFSNDNKRCFFAFNVCNRWLSLRLDVICAGVVLMVSFIAVIMVNMGSAVDENVLGLAIVYSIQLLDSLQWTARVIIETENNLTSVERLLAFNEIEKESLSASQNSKLPDSWPSDGRVRITDLSMRYRNGLPLVLKRISLDVPGGCKLGICGRTGSGKR
jgi:ABC-type multidrug transport system fused ATPase/permease subunit